MRFQPSIGRNAGITFVSILSVLIADRSPLAAQQAPQFELHPTDSGAGAQSQLRFTVPADRKVRLALTSSSDTPDTVDLTLSMFVDGSGNSAPVRIALPTDTARAAAELLEGVVIDRAIFPLQLDVGELPTPGDYVGTLFVSRGTEVLTHFQITLSRAKVASPAVLVLDQQTVTRTYTQPFLGRSLGPDFTVHLWEAGREWTLDDLFVRLVGVGESFQPYDLTQRLRFEVNGDTIDHLWSVAPRTDAGTGLRIAPGERTAVRGEFSGLGAGEYTTTLRFLAANSQEDDRQLLNLTLRVRHSGWWALLAVLGAIFFSFVSSKWLRTRRQRLRLQGRIRALRPAWLDSEPSVMSVISLRALVKQADDLTRGGILLSAPEMISDRIKQANELLKPLNRVRKIRRDIELLDQDDLLKRRARKALRLIVARLGTGRLDEKLSAEIDAQLTDLEGWFLPDRLEACYEEYLERDIRSLLRDFRPQDATEDEEERAVIDELVMTLRQPAETDESSAADNFAQVLERERNYSKLKILWERRNLPEFHELVQLCRENASVDKVFDRADETAWARLKAAAENKQIRFVSPRVGAGTHEAYRPLEFEIAPDDPKLGKNYLFKHKLQYEWRIDLQSASKKTATVPLRPRTDQPRVVQFAARPGRLRASVTMKYGADEAEPVTMELEDVTGSSAKQKGEAKIAQWLPIRPSSVFIRRRAFQSIEVITLVLAGAVALATGMLKFYLDDPTFGSANDYLLIFLWGAALEGGADFVTASQRFEESAQVSEEQNV